jgi:hypothetical protein
MVSLLPQEQCAGLPAYHFESYFTFKSPPLPGKRRVATRPTKLIAADNKKTSVKEPSVSAIHPPMGGEIVWAMPNTNVAAA